MKHNTICIPVVEMHTCAALCLVVDRDLEASTAATTIGFATRSIITSDLSLLILFAMTIDTDRVATYPREDGLLIAVDIPLLSLGKHCSKLFPLSAVEKEANAVKRTETELKVVFMCVRISILLVSSEVIP